MTKRLDDAIADLRALPEAEHDWAAENIWSIMRERARSAEYQLSPEQIDGVRRTLANLDAGRERLLTEEETDQMWRRLGA